MTEIPSIGAMWNEGDAAVGGGRSWRFKECLRFVSFVTF